MTDDLCARGDKMNRSKASDKLSALELKLTMEEWKLEILWYRVMELSGEWQIDRHTHSTYEVHIIAEGSCRVQLDKKSFDIEAGWFYMTPPGIYHEQLSNNENRFVEYSLNVDIRQPITIVNKDNKYGEEVVQLQTESDLVMKIFQSTVCKPYDLSNSPVIDLFEKALSEAEEEKLGYYSIIRGTTKEIMIQMARVMTDLVDIHSETVPKKLKADGERLNLIFQYIQDNLSTKITASNIARHLHLSEKQINRIVMRHTGRSIKKIIKEEKLKEAKRLLKETNMSQKEIALILGFTSEHYFNQFFKREEGDTPGNFRTNVGNVRKY